jgi:hypothetical protein
MNPALGWDLPPGTTYDDLDTATDGDDTVEPAPMQPGLCVPCHESGFIAAAIPGTDECEECAPAFPVAERCAS